MEPSNSFELEHLLSNYTRSPEFAKLETKRQQGVLNFVRDKYLKDNPEDIDAANVVTNRVNEGYLRAVGEGRYIPDREEFNTVFPWEDNEWSIKNDEEKISSVEKFKTEQAESLAAEDPTNINDRLHYLNGISDSVVRSVRGKDRGWKDDKGSRFWNGAMAGMAAKAGAHEFSEKLRNFFPENPDYDEDFSAKLASGFGDVLSSTVVFIAGMGLAGGNPAGGLATSLGGNATQRYGEGYRQAIDLGLDEDKAIDAGVASMPGAAVDVLGDRLLTMKFLPTSMVKGVSSVSDKRQLLADALKDQSLRQKGFRVMKGAFVEGATEVGGDYTSGYGAYLSSDYEQFLPSSSEMWDALSVGAVIGGTMSGGREVLNLRYDPEAKRIQAKPVTQLREFEANIGSIVGNPSVPLYLQQEIDYKTTQLLRRGDVAGALELANTEPPPIPEAFSSAETTINNQLAPRFENAPQTIGSNQEPRLLDNTKADPLPFQFEPIEISDPAAAKLSEYFINERSPEISAELNELAPNRARVSEEIAGLSEGTRNVTPEQTPAVQSVVDLVAAKWASANPTKTLDSFYERLSFTNPETLRSFNFIADKFVSTTPDSQRSRRIGRAATFERDGQTTVAASKSADVAAVTHNLIGALRASGIIQEVIGQDGMAIVETELGKTQVDEDFDQTLADSMLDWMERQEPSDNPSSTVFQNLKEWISDIYQALRNIFGPVQGSQALDEQYSRLFDFVPYQAQQITPVAAPETPGAATNERLGRNTPVEGFEKPITPTNSKHARAIRERIKQAAKEARQAKSKVPLRSPLGTLNNPYRPATEAIEPGAYDFNTWKSKMTVVEMEIDEYLDLVDYLPEESMREEAYQALVVRNELMREPIYIGVLDREGQTSKVFSHEGRHRALALKAKGYTHIPVIFESTRIRWDQQQNPEVFDYIENWPTVLQPQEGATLKNNIIYPLDRLGNWQGTVAARGPLVNLQDDTSGFASFMADAEVVTRQMKLDVNAERSFQIFGERMYTSSIGKVAVKELTQNSFDAIKGAIDKGQIEKGEIKIKTGDIDEDTQFLTITDNGTGMTPEVVQSAFFTLAGTNKETDRSSGGLGVAKIAILMAAERIKLETVRDGVLTELDITSDQLRKGLFDVKSKNTERPNGTEITIYLPAKKDQKRIYINYDENLVFSDEVDVEQWEEKRNRISPSVLIEEEFKVTDISSPDADATIYLKRFPKKNKDGSIKYNEEVGNTLQPTAEIKVFSNGLYQFKESELKVDPRDWTSDRLPYMIYVDIHPKADPTSNEYPFNNSREGFVSDSEIARKINEVIEELRELEKINAFKSEFEIITDLNGNPATDKRKPIVYNNTDLVLSNKDREVINFISQEIFNVTDEIIKAAVSPEFLSTKEEVSEFSAGTSLTKIAPKDIDIDSENSEYQKSDQFFYGAGISKNWGGVNTRIEPRVILVNPIYNNKLFENIKSPIFSKMYANYLFHITFHEINHIENRNEGAGFTWGLAQLEPILALNPQIREKFTSTIEQYVNENIETLRDLRERYEKADVLDPESEVTGSSIGDRETDGPRGDLQGQTRGISNDPSRAREDELTFADLYKDRRRASLSTIETSGGRIQAASNGVSFYYNLPGYSIDSKGIVKLGKLVSSKTGEVPETALKNLTGFDGTQLKEGEIELYKRLVPIAFEDGKVNLRALIIGLEDTPMVIEQYSTELTPQQKQKLFTLEQQYDRLDKEARVFVAKLNDTYVNNNSSLDAQENERQILNAEINQLRFLRDKVFREIDRLNRNEFTLTAPKNPSQMPGYVEIAVRIPENNIISTGFRDKWSHFKFPDVVTHFRGYEEIVGSNKAFHVIEIQSDWEAESKNKFKDKLEKAKNAKYEDAIITFDPETDVYNVKWLGLSESFTGSFASLANFTISSREAFDDLKQKEILEIISLISNTENNINPLLEQYQSLAIKAAIQHANKINASFIMLSDSKTAMMTQGHDKSAARLHHPRYLGKYVIVNPQGIVLQGLYYDTQKEVDEIISEDELGEDYKDYSSYLVREEHTKVKIHQQKGMEVNYDDILPKLFKKHTKSKGFRTDVGKAKRRSKVFNKDNVTGLAYDISQVPPTVESLFNLVEENNRAISPEFFAPEGNRRIRNGRDLVGWLQESQPELPLLNNIIFNEELLTYLDGVKVKQGRDSYYDPATNAISLAQDSLSIDTDAVHELTHALLLNAIEKDGQFRFAIQSIMGEAMDLQGSPEATRLQQIIFKANEEFAKNETPSFDWWFSQNWRSIQSKLRAEGIETTMQDMRNAYAMLNPDEFTAAFTSDAKFRSLLESIEGRDGRTLWQKILDAIKSLFGIQRDSQDLASRMDTLLNKAFESGSVVGHAINTPQLSALNRSFNLGRDQKKTPHERATETFFTRFARIRKGLNDQSDSYTQRIRKILSKVNPKNVLLLDESDQADVFDLINNIYLSRTSSTHSPELRVKSEKMIESLEKYKYLIDQAAIGRLFDENDGIVNFDLFEGDWDNLSEVEQFVNDALLDLNKAGDKKKISEKDDTYRAKAEEGREEILKTTATAEDWIHQVEEVNGNNLRGESFRAFNLFHFDYLMNVDLDQLSGKELYTHWFAINNLMDGRPAYYDVTIKHIARLRDAEIPLEELRNTFNDPMVHRNRFLESIDEIARMTELMQTQLDRMSSFINAKNWVQGGLMGDLLGQTIGEAENIRVGIIESYTEFREEKVKQLGRDLSGTDLTIMDMVARLRQYAARENADAAILNSIEEERQTFKNVEKEGNKAQKKNFKENIVPIFESLVEGVENSDSPMETFMSDIEYRLGRGNPSEGRLLYQLINKMTEGLNSLALDQEFISEGFHRKPFDYQVHYMPKILTPIRAEKIDDKTSAQLDSPQEEFESAPYQMQSMVAIPSHMKTRINKVGDKRFYRYNIESTFDRAIRMSAMASATTVERFILKERLKEGGVVANLIMGDSGKRDRVTWLESWAKELIYNAMYNGENIGFLNEFMSQANKLYGRVALSGLHHVATQPASAFVDYHIRTQNISGLMDAASFMVTHKSEIDEFFNVNSKWVKTRALLGERSLDKSSPIYDTTSIRSNPMVKKLEAFYEGAGDLITFAIRHGDDFSAKSIILAEYVRLMKKKGLPIESINDLDLSGPVEGKILVQAIVNAERNVNTSNKTLRGQLHTDRRNGTAYIRNTSFAFSSHVMTLAAQMNIAVRDIYELHKRGADRSEIEPHIRTIGAIISQTLMFSAGRYAINGAIAMGILSLLRDLFDDEEGKIEELNEKVRFAKETGDSNLIIEAEQELREVTAIRKSLDKFKQRNSFESFGKNVVRDQLSTAHFAFSFHDLPQRIMFMYPDKRGQMIMTQQKEEGVAAMRDKIRDLKSLKRFGEADKLSEQLVLLENASYIPFRYKDFDNIGVGGITGASIGAALGSIEDAMGGAMGLTEWNLNDAVLAAQSAGLGQAEILRYFREVDRIEDALWDSRRGLEERKEKGYAKELERLKADRERKRKALIKKLIE